MNLLLNTILVGIEFPSPAFIIPTLNEYLGHLGGDAVFFGVVMAAFSFSSVLASPIYGLVQDHLRQTKVVILFANLWEIAGGYN